MSDDMEDAKLNYCEFCSVIVISDDIADDAADLVVRSGVRTKDGWVCRQCVEEMIEEQEESYR